MAQLGVERDGGLIDGIGLHEDHVGPHFLADLPEFRNKRGGKSLAAIPFVHGEVVEVDFASLLLELAQFVGNESTDQIAIYMFGDKHDTGWVGMQPVGVGIVRFDVPVRFRFEGHAKHVQEFAKRARIYLAQSYTFIHPNNFHGVVRSNRLEELAFLTS